MSGAVEQGAHIGLAAPRHIDNQDAALGLVPNDALEGHGGARFAWAQAIRLGDGAHRGADAYVDHILTATLAVFGPLRRRRLALLVSTAAGGY